MTLSIVGAGLAGCEAAWAAANRGVRVTLYEMKPERYSPAHRSPLFAELVCSNSFKADRLETAAGLLKAEMRCLGSLLLEVAAECAVPAGGALAVDRERFAAGVTSRVKVHPNITCIGERVDKIPSGPVVIATGPLTDGALAEDIKLVVGGEYLHFYDAASPIVTADSLDREICFAGSRYGRGGDDYLNCPFTREEYEAFYAALVSAEPAPLHDFDTPGAADGRGASPDTPGEVDGRAASPKVYEGCMPVEVLARRGEDAIRFGPLKPVGLRDPRTGHRPWAAVQLRREDAAGSLYNLVGFQTNLRFSEQKRVFSMIPGLLGAEFVRYGVMHRNSFLKSLGLLDADFSVKREPRVSFAGQLTGVEGYMESAASGIIAGINAARRLSGEQPFVPPEYTMIGALCRYVSGYEGGDFQPMGANFGLLPPLSVKIRDKRERYLALSRRALSFYGDDEGAGRP